MTNFPWPMDKPIEEIEEEVERNKDGYDQFVLSDIRYLLTRLKRAEGERECEWIHVVPDGIGTWWESSCGLLGNPPSEDWRFCPECGGKIVRSEEVKE